MILTRNLSFEIYYVSVKISLVDSITNYKNDIIFTLPYCTTIKYVVIRQPS